MADGQMSFFPWGANGGRVIKNIPRNEGQVYFVGIYIFAGLLRNNGNII